MPQLLVLLQRVGLGLVRHMLLLRLESAEGNRGVKRSGRAHQAAAGARKACVRGRRGIKGAFP